MPQPQKKAATTTETTTAATIAPATTIAVTTTWQVRSSIESKLQTEAQEMAEADAVFVSFSASAAADHRSGSIAGWPNVSRDLHDELAKSGLATFHF